MGTGVLWGAVGRTGTDGTPRRGERGGAGVSGAGGRWGAVERYGAGGRLLPRESDAPVTDRP
ncbi:hypothetical protein SHJG_4668 [Streptomyces hygroscopicus subsp. jinggangensis 5008]|nr:hypothetical protein SHJG_4668 [Streptomyces hygroscopicus subsp. jinggangensis 5008]AGF64095.1 hypothetical protein SHJGH_4430 [Streptomyces hygroscopicus subsp. jinggangensis TL01]